MTAAAHDQTNRKRKSIYLPPSPVKSAVAAAAPSPRSRSPPRSARFHQHALILAPQPVHAVHRRRHENRLAANQLQMLWNRSTSTSGRTNSSGGSPQPSRATTLALLGPAKIRSMVLRELLWIVGLGLGIGIAAALAASRVFESSLFGVQGRDASVVPSAQSRPPLPPNGGPPAAPLTSTARRSAPLTKAVRPVRLPITRDGPSGGRSKLNATNPREATLRPVDWRTDAFIVLNRAGPVSGAFFPVARHALRRHI